MKYDLTGHWRLLLFVIERFGFLFVIVFILGLSDLIITYGQPFFVRSFLKYPSSLFIEELVYELISLIVFVGVLNGYSIICCNFVRMYNTYYDIWGHYKK